MSAQRAIYFTSYEIPIVNLNLPARQNRTQDGKIRITPGMYEPIEFWIANADGIPINLAQFTVRFLAWKVNRRDTDSNYLADSEIVFSRDINVIDPYQGKFVILFSDDDTLLMARPGYSSLRWSLFFINNDNQVFPATVTQSGSRFGMLEIDIESGIPSSDMILTTAGSNYNNS